MSGGWSPPQWIQKGQAGNLTNTGEKQERDCFSAFGGSQ
jgi:hypothetical protein